MRTLLKITRPNPNPPGVGEVDTPREEGCKDLDLMFRAIPDDTDYAWIILFVAGLIFFTGLYYLLEHVEPELVPREECAAIVEAAK